MKVSLKKAFSILDGRLSTDIGDVYKMLNFIYNDNLMTHQLPTAMRRLKEINPVWFSTAVDILNEIKRTNQTDDFESLMKILDEKYSGLEINLEQIDEKINPLAGLERFMEE